MGKRKYDKESTESTKKKKVSDGAEENAQNISEADQPQNVENDDHRIKNATFDIKHFRKELAKNQGQTMVLTQFLQVCLNPDNDVDYLLEYLKAGGNSHEILRQVSQDNKKNLTLATPAFHIFHLIIVKVQSSLPHMISITEEACRYFLNTFMPTVEIMVSENSASRHRKIILNLLTSMVTLNSDLGVELLTQVPLTPKHLQYIVDRPNCKEKENVRNAFVHFMTSFLVDGHFPLIKALLEKQGLLPLVIPGLVQDEPEAVLMFLNILKKNVIENTLISKTLKLKTFSHQVLHNLFKVFMWKGPPEMNADLRSDSRPEIMELLSDVMLTLFTSHRLGLYFVDKALGTSDVNKNQNLYKAVLSLKRPWENEKQCEVILQIMFKCPDLHRAIINVIEQSFQPLHSPIWEKATNFTIQLLDTMQPGDMTARFSSLTTIQITNFIRFVTLPVPLLKHIQENIGKDVTVSLYCIKVLVKMLQTLKGYIKILENEESNENITELRNKLDNFLPKHVPSPALIVGLIQNVINGGETSETTEYRLPKVKDTESLLSLIDLLLLYNYIHPAFFESLEGNLDMKKILDYSMSIKDGQTALLKFKIVSLWLMLDNTIISLNNPMFKDLFHILLEVYSSDTDSTWLEAKETLIVFFKNTGIFEADEDEIHLMLYTLRNAKVEPISLIGETVEYALANSKELAEYIKNQMINFEVTNESSRDSLDKLFNDLMSNRCTGDSVFLESKIPSSYIVGCMQFILNQKEKKEHLKNFLSLYVINLLHYNYSPELTEVLIGDSKLDARSYVVAWTSQAVSIPETFSKDDVLKSLSKSLLSTEVEPLQNIFPLLELASDENDIMIMNIAYKINLSKSLDSSELFVWAKYIMFCIVRLVSMNQLTDLNLQKAENYFECIIALGRKHHMLPVCKNIILNVLKNSHFLKIYTPLDNNKSFSNTLATKFILKVITENGDIIDNLNQKHTILESYQQKNYSEIMKAIVKINKRKNVNNEHTMNVLEIIGLSREDDILVLNEIFNSSIESCVKDDKEPSLVLELLRMLIEKYSKSIISDLSREHLKNALKLYFELLTNKEMTSNLTRLESAFVQHFENKPHQAVLITETEFKQFFCASNIRKTTSQLAFTLLKNNDKLCNVFKQELSRPEILSQRELTLPLGMALIDHKKFLSENKEMLLMVYNEYKSNICKFLEKPHKVGQIYILSWKFIRKLIIECMDIEDCKKTFAKNHKFEVAEASHVHLLQAVFLKTCALNEGLNNEHLINYFTNFLQITIIGIKENKGDKFIEDILLNIYNVAHLCKHVAGFNLNQTEEFSKFTESSVWQNYCKVVLRDALKVRTMEKINSTGPLLLCLLSKLIKLFYPDDSDDIVMLFDMVTSHSEFLNVMLSYHSPDIKTRLLELLFVLVSKNKSVMKSQQIPVYLSAYHATKRPSDRLITKILHFYESNGQPLNDYKPYVFGDSAANYYAVRKNRTSSLWGHPTPNQVMNLLEKDTIEQTMKRFPVNQKLEHDYELPSNIYLETGNSLVKIILEEIQNSSKNEPANDNEAMIKAIELKAKREDAMDQLKNVDIMSFSHTESDDDIYDPLFLFPLMSHLLAPGSVASCFKMMRIGLLSVPVMGLSSHCPQMRAAAYHVLHRFCLLLETEPRHRNDKLQLTDFITTLRQSLTPAVDSSTGEALINPRVPAIGALYLAKGLMVSTSPSDSLYKSVNNFLIAKQFVNLTVVPDFLNLFHDSDVEFVDRRLWILDVIKDGTKTMTDVKVVFKTMCVKMIMDYQSTVISDRKTKERILNALNSILLIPRAFEILVEGHGFMPWLHSIVRLIRKDEKNIVRTLFCLLKNMLITMDLSLFQKYYDKYTVNSKNVDVFADFKVKSDIEYKIMNIAYSLLSHIDDMDVEDVMAYIEVFRLITKRTLKFLTKKEMLNVIKKCSDRMKSSDSVKMLVQSVVSKNAIMVRSKMVDGRNPNGTFLSELKTLVITYLT